MAFFNLNRKKTVQDATISVDRKTALLSGRAYPALENSAFWSCVTKLCRQYGTMPWHLYKQNGNYRSVVSNTPLSYLMNHPCTYMTSYQWRFVMGFNFEVHGVAMAKIERKGKTVTNLYPISPKLLMPNWVDNRLYWKYKTEQIPDEDLLRIVSTPIGYADVLSPVDYSQVDLEVASNSKTLQSNYYKNGASIGGILTVPRGTSKEMKQQMQAMLATAYSGSANAHKTMILEDSMKYEPIHLDESDVSKIANAQNWTVDEVARRFGVPPFFCGDMSKATYANAEQQGMDVVIYALQPRFIAWESAFNQLCGDGEYTKFSLGGLMRGDHAARSAFYHNGIMDGWLSVNDVRELEDMNPIEGGDAHYFPLNYGKINPDGSIEQPQSQTPSFNPFDLPTDEKKKKCGESVMQEKKARDRLFLEATNNVTRTNRSKIEAIMRRQVKACTDKLKELMASSYDNNTIAQELQTYCDSVSVEFGNEYVAVFKDVIYRLLPIIKKQIGTEQEVNKDALDSYAGKFGQQMAGRFGTQRVREVEKTHDYEELEELKSKWAEVPATDSMEETQRAGNAFNVFLYGQLGLNYMHVVASPDACEFCQNLDGKVVEVNGNILTKGDETPDGQGNIRYINKNYKHPPFHSYCTCTVAPGK